MEDEPKRLEGVALFAFTTSNPLRRLFFVIVNSGKFDALILTCIIVSSILLAVESPLTDPDGSLMAVLNVLDLIFTIVFTLELVMKNIAMGFIFNGKQSYIRNPWNIIDFIIVLFSLISLFATNVDLSIFKALRLLRVLRPLRMISKNEGLKISIQALLKALPSIGNVSIISLLFFLIFGIIGVNYFKGQFFYCAMDKVPSSLQANVVDQWSCIDLGGVWLNKDANFDNVVSAIITLFEMSTAVGWSITMFSGIDAVGLHKQPLRDNAMYWIAFFVFFIIVGNLFILNLFVGVVISTFNSEKEKLGKDFLLTDR